MLRIASSPEITSALADVAKDTTLAPDGYLTPALGSSTDNWTFASAGVPGCNFRERTAAFYSLYYHTNMDTIELVDSTRCAHSRSTFSASSCASITDCCRTA